MRIAFIAGTLDRGGAEALVSEWCQRLSQEHELSVVCVLGDWGPYVKSLRSLGVRVQGLTRHSLRNPFAVLELIRCLRGFRPDIVHSQLDSSLPQQALAILLARRPGFVVTSHNTHRPRTALGRIRARMGWYLASPCIDAVVGVSQGVSDELASRFGRRSRRRINTIYNGIDLSRFTRCLSGAADREPMGLHPADKVILCVASLTQQKNHRCLIEAMALLVNQVDNAKLVLVGDGPLGSELRELVERHGLSPHVFFVGPRDDVPRLLAAADLFVLPSLWEGFGLVLAEAQAAGLPVVATDISGVREVVVAGETGLLVPPSAPTELASAMSCLLTQQGLAQAMARRGQEYVKAHFDIDTCSRAYEALYQRLIVERGSLVD